MAAKVILIVVGVIVVKGRVFFICVKERDRWRRIVFVGDIVRDGEVVDESVRRCSRNFDICG